MTVFVLDSNIVSYYLRSHTEVIRNIRDALAAGDKLLIAPIAYYEVKRGLLAVKSKRRLKEFIDFCEEFGVGVFDNSILDIAAEIYVDRRDKGRLLEDADIFIAAFCKYHGFALVTGNTKHFEDIQGLTIFDWTRTL